jgi:hypothetical protein
MELIRLILILLLKLKTLKTTDKVGCLNTLMNSLNEVIVVI